MEENCEEKEVEEVADLEEDSLGGENVNDDDDYDVGTSIVSDILDYKIADVWCKVLASAHLMQEVVAKFLSAPPSSITLTTTTPKLMGTVIY